MLREHLHEYHNGANKCCHAEVPSDVRRTLALTPRELRWTLLLALVTEDASNRDGGGSNTFISHAVVCLYKPSTHAANIGRLSEITMYLKDRAVIQ